MLSTTLLTFPSGQVSRQSPIFVEMTFPKKHIPLEEGDFYLTPEGYKCFTEQYHLKRGYCCESSCRHCPYGYTKRTNRQD